jgi:hypothetical protein
MYLGINYNRFFAQRRCHMAICERFGLRPMVRYIHIMYGISFFESNRELLTMFKLHCFLSFCHCRLNGKVILDTVKELLDLGIISCRKNKRGALYYKSISLTPLGEDFIKDCDAYIKGFRAMELFKQNLRAEGKMIKEYKKIDGRTTRKKKRGRKKKRIYKKRVVLPIVPLDNI